MVLKSLPYISRSEQEKELDEFLLTHLNPRSSTTKSVLISGVVGVGKKMLVDNVIQANDQLKEYTCIEFDLKKQQLKNFNDGKHPLLKKLFISINQVAIAGIPEPITRLLLTIVTTPIFTEWLFKEKSIPNFSNLQEIEDFVFLHIENTPTVLIINNFDLYPEHIRFLAHLVEVSYQRQISFVVMLLFDDEKENAHAALKNIRKFRANDPIFHIHIPPFTREACIASLSPLGLPENWINILHQFSSGYPVIMNYLWKTLQKKKLLYLTRHGWTVQDEEWPIFPNNLIREALNKRLRQYKIDIPPQFHELLLDCLFLSSAMGETFIPQAITEIALPTDKDYTKDEIETWEDIWFEFLEYNDINTTPMAVPVKEENKIKYVQSESIMYSLYAFSDPNLRIILQHAAKQFCNPLQNDANFKLTEKSLKILKSERLPDKVVEKLKTIKNEKITGKDRFIEALKLTIGDEPTERYESLFLRHARDENDIYRGLSRLDSWLETYFQKEWRKQVLPYRITINRTLWKHTIADSLYKLYYMDQLRNQLHQRIEKERYLVRAGKLPEDLYYLLLWNAEILEEKYQYHEALAIGLEANSLVEEKTVELNEENLANLRNQLGKLYRLNGNYPKAEIYLQQALTIRKKIFGSKHPDVASSLTDIAALLFDQGKYSEAEPLIRHALRIFEARLGIEHLSVAVCLSNLAALLFDQGKYSEAEPLIRHALRIREVQLGNDHLETATSLNQLARLLQTQGKLAEAELLFRRALRIREVQLGNDHPFTTSNLNYLAALLSVQGKLAEAEPLFRKVLKIKETLLDKMHPDVGNVLNNLGTLFLAQGKYTEAEPHLRRALEICEAVFGKNHSQTIPVRNNLESLLKEMETSKG